MNIILNFLNRVKGWFFHWTSGDIVIGNRYVVIVCKAIENTPNELGKYHIKKAIEKSMKDAGLEKRFSRFIKRKIEKR